MEVRAGTPTAGTASWARSRARSSATMPAGERGFCSTASRGSSIPSATSRPIPPCAASAAAGGSSAKWSTRSTRTCRRAGVPLCFGFPNPRALKISQKDRRDAHALSGPHRAHGRRRVPGASARRRRRATSSTSRSILSGRPPVGVATHAPLRDRARVNWRFHARPTRYYRMVWRAQSGRDDRRGRRSPASATERRRSSTSWVSSPTEATCRRSSPPRPPRPARLGARRLAFWETPGGPGRAPIAALPGERIDAGFPMDRRASSTRSLAKRFAERLAFVPSLYDVV